MKFKTLYSTVTTMLLLLLIGFGNPLFSQLKVGDNPRSINSDAMLEIESGSKGLLLPRVSLKSTTSANPLKRFTKGMVVFNTSTMNDVTPGLYYCDGISWVRANTEIKPSLPDTVLNTFWSIKGNNNVISNSFLGSINNAPLIIKTNNTERLRITENGWLGIGTSTPKAALEVKGQMVLDSVSLGNKDTDKILVANLTDGRVKYLPTTTFINSVQNYNETVAFNGKTIFSTPATITDINKIFLYRNGVLILFTINNSNSIISEIPCKQGDQIKIVQLL